MRVCRWEMSSDHWQHYVFIHFIRCASMCVCFCSLHLSQTNVKFITIFTARSHTHAHADNPSRSSTIWVYFLSCINVVIFLRLSHKRNSSLIHWRARADNWASTHASERHTHFFVSSSCFHLWSHWVIGRWELHSCKQFAREASLRLELFFFLFCFYSIFISFYDRIAPESKVFVCVLQVINAWN